MMVAIRDSAREPAPLSGDGVKLFKLIGKKNNPKVDEILLDPDGPLKQLHARVRDAGCEVNPPWSPLKAIFVPCSEQQIEDLIDQRYELMDHHILALSSDADELDKALRENICKKSRPKLKTQGPPSDSDDEPRIVETSLHADTDSSLGFPSYSARTD